jgi:hypothetical protein
MRDKDRRFISDVVVFVSHRYQGLPKIARLCAAASD